MSTDLIARKSLESGRVPLPFRLPPIAAGGGEPKWDGKHFTIDGVRVNVLNYGSTDKGWNDELTSFHEDTAGSDHFIDVASRAHAVGQVLRFVRANRPVLMDVGCSSGFMLKQLHYANPNGVTIGADIVKEPLEQLALHMPGVPLLRFDLLECPLPDNCIDGTVLLNVLEHIERDHIAVQQLFRITRPGGFVVIEVPAGPELYDNYDKMLMHYRRYEMSGLKKLFSSVGFKIEYASHLGSFIYPGFWTVKQLSKLRPPSPEAESKAVEKKITQTRSSKLMKLLTGLELALGKSVSYPFGIRCLLTCSKPR